MLVGLGSTQFIIGNLIEPAFVGCSLNLSSFVIIISLTFWGVVWGLPGMFLSVPIMVTLQSFAPTYRRYTGLRCSYPLMAELLEITRISERLFRFR